MSPSRDLQPLYTVSKFYVIDNWKKHECAHLWYKYKGIKILIDTKIIKWYDWNKNKFKGLKSAVLFLRR